ncbi:MAG: hypothetical protein HDT10_00325 [Helicobacter sp.]|nr:hypothetical protein [Helicobacter sp.]
MVCFVIPFLAMTNGESQSIQDYRLLQILHTLANKAAKIPKSILLHKTMQSLCLSYNL